MTHTSTEGLTEHKKGFLSYLIYIRAKTNDVKERIVSRHMTKKGNTVLAALKTENSTVTFIFLKYKKSPNHLMVNVAPEILSGDQTNMQTYT